MPPRSPLNPYASGRALATRRLTHKATSGSNMPLHPWRRGTICIKWENLLALTMANIYCTKKFQQLVGKKLIQQDPVESMLGNWNAHLFPLQGRKCLILMNDQSYYTLIFLDILKKDILNFHDLFSRRIIEQLSYDDIDFPMDSTPKVLDDLTPHFLPTNNNRKVLGTINEFIHIIKLHLELNYSNQIKLINLLHMNSNLNKELIGALGPKSGYGIPRDEMKKIVEKVYGKMD